MLKRSDIVTTILFDNYSYAGAIEKNLKTLWGFSCYIETPDKTILFDTGSNGRVLLKNMTALKKNINTIDCIFLSHHHWDHIGGLDSVIELNSHVEIVAPTSISKLMIKDLKTQVSSVSVVGHEPTQIYSDIYSTGTMGEDVEEQSIIVDSDAGLIVITGCAHNGIVEIVKKAQQFFNKKINLVMGGFHLMGEDESMINGVIEEFKQLDIDYFCATHCTGDLAKRLLNTAFDKEYLEGGLGKCI